MTSSTLLGQRTKTSLTLERYASTASPSAPEETSSPPPLVEESNSLLGDIPEWYADAACSGEPDEVFFGDSKEEREEEDISKHAPDMNDQEVARAKAICEGCDVQEQCRMYALMHFIDYGVWGGLTHRERLAWWKQHGGRRYLRRLEGFSSL